MYEKQIRRWRDQIDKRGGSNEALQLVDRTLSLLEEIDQRMSAFSRWDEAGYGSGLMVSLFVSALDRVANVIGSPLDELAYDWVSSVASGVLIAIDSMPDEDRHDLMVPQAFVQEANSLLSEARRVLAARALSAEQVRLLDEAKAAAEQANSAAAKAQQSAGVSGSSSLSEHFATYASSERRAAEVFRALAIAGVFGALLAAVASGPIQSGDWTHLTYRVAVVAAVGALAAYFARQAGQHRRVFNWAKSLEVQLKSFPAFIEPVPVDERAEIYRAFARRVLSAPPEKGAESDYGVGGAQVLDLVTSLAKRT